MLRYLLILFILTGCASQQHRKAKRNVVKTERAMIDTLGLVKSIPVVLVDSLHIVSLASIFSQQLTSNGFSQISRKELNALIIEFRDRLVPLDPKVGKRQ